MQVVLVGFGRIGSRLVPKILAARGRVTVVDGQGPRVELAEATYGGSGLRGIAGDATQERVLLAAGADQADTVIATTRSDPVNLMVCSLARRLDVAHVVSLVNEPEVEPIFLAEGVSVVKNPSHLTAEYLYHAFELPGIRTFMPLGEEGKVVTTIIHPGSDLAGKTLQESGIGKDVLVAAIRRGGRVILPRGTTKLQPGDLVTAVARTSRVESLMTRVTSATGLDLLWREARRVGRRR